MTTVQTDAGERALIEAAQRDPSRFGELYELHFERIYAYVARRVGARDAAEDLTAEVFHQALANLAKYEWRGLPFAAWLYRIATNAISDRWQRAAREQGTAAAALPGHTDVDFEEIERRARIFRLVEALPGEQRRVVKMRFAEEKSAREIAQAIGKSEGAVKQLQFRALENLRARAAESGGAKGLRSAKGAKTGGRHG